MKVKIKSLYKGFTFNMVTGERITVPKGTKVVRVGNKLYFVTDESKSIFKQPIVGLRIKGKYYVLAYGQLKALEPFEPETPFPFCMLEW